MPVNETHDPNLKSWVESANDPNTDFPIQNLAYCIVDDRPRRGGGAIPIDEVAAEREAVSSMNLSIRIGDQLLHLGRLAHRLARRSLVDASPEGTLVRIIGQARHQLRSDTSAIEGAAWAGRFSYPSFAKLSTLRDCLSKLLAADNPRVRDDDDLRACLSDASRAAYVSPTTIPNYTDFYASKHHATNVGSMFRPDNPLLPNYKHVPIAYHGRASSIVPSGADIRRPSGQTKADDAQDPTFGPCKMLDYEMELGLFIGRGNELGDPIPINQAHEHIFGMCIVNDWSARDLQKWEYQPLGPFLAKNFATTISPFVVTMEALEPFRIPGPERDPGDPQPLPYLRTSENWGLDITVEVHVASKQMRDKGVPPVRLSKGNFKHMYWTIAQMVAHHASNGCNLQPGDLLASGTISGPTKDSRGCLLELTWDGLDPATGKPRPRVPVQLPTGETRTFLADGDEVIMMAYCERPGFRRIGFGECRGTILPAKAQ